MASYPSVADRYYQRYTWNTEKKFSGHSGPARVLRHSNRILVSCLHPEHPVRNQTIKKVTFQISEKCDRGSNKVSGKRKKGGQWLNETAPILRIETEESEEPILIQSGCRGTLVEVNNQIIENPQLLLEQSEGRGYIAVVLPRGEELGAEFGDDYTLDKDRVEAEKLSDENARACSIPSAC